MWRRVSLSDVGPLGPKWTNSNPNQVSYFITMQSEFDFLSQLKRGYKELVNDHVITLEQYELLILAIDRRIVKLVTDVPIS